MKKTLQWFKQRIGKEIYRDPTKSDNMFAKKLGYKKVNVVDENHAQYLFDIQNDFIADEVHLNYRDKIEK